ncbi:hypothetical protein MN116_008613 [Schistosoma mekongi]|uniref:Uncharacterized protein n=1 Tax=Schistosoma mekongi TaxID=38744 RepID=A0AAE1Z508_SCHME|nr:hypothetical protein MN116_008613 [Schistosoma mekongi]
MNISIYYYTFGIFYSFGVILDIVDARRLFQYNIAFIIPLVIGLTGIICLVGILTVIYYRRKRRIKQEKNSSNCISLNHKQLKVTGKTDSKIKLNANELQSSSKVYPSYSITSEMYINSSNLTTTSSLSSLYPKTTTVTKSITPRCPTQPPLPIIKNKKSFEK